MRYILFILLLHIFFFIDCDSFAQNANISYEVRVNSSGVRSTEGSSLSSSSCQEVGNEEYTANVRVDDGSGTGTYVCMTCDNNGDCNYGANTVIRTNTNVSPVSGLGVTITYDMFEDDGGARCSFNSGDDCRANNSYALNLITTWFPTAANTYVNYTDNQVYNSGSSEHRIRLDNSWRYAGTASSITPACNVQNVTHSSGSIRSHSVSLTAGVTYQFETTSGPDTYLRLYSSDGFTIVAQNDNFSGTLSRIIYTAPSSGTYYIENSQFNRTALSSNSNFAYSIVTPSAPVISTSATNCTSINVSWSSVLYAQGYEMQVSTDAGFLSNIAGNNCGGVACNGAVNLGNVTSASVTGLTEGTTYYIRLRAINGATPCRSVWSNVLTVTTLANSTAPTTISPSSSICSGASVTLSASGGSDGAGASFQWFTGTCGSSVIGTGSSITVTPANGQVYLVRRTGTCNTTSCASVTINHFGTLSSGAVGGLATLTQCDGGNPTSFSVGTPTGGNGSYSYQWEQSAGCSGTWINATAEDGITNTLNFNPPVLNLPTSSMCYRLRVTDGCGTIVYSSTKTFNVVSDPVSQTVVPSVTPGTVCVGALLSSTFSGGSGGTGTISENYEFTTNGTSWSAYTPGDNITVTSAMIGSNMIGFRTQRTASGIGCNNGTVQSVFYNVNADPVVNFSGLTDVCSGTSATFVPSVSGGQGAVTNYLWEIFSGGIWSNVQSALSPANYTTNPSISPNTYQYRLTVTQSGTGCSGTSSAQQMIVANSPSAGTISHNILSSTICEGQLVFATMGLGSGGIGSSNVYEYSTNGGSSWLPYTSGSNISSVGLAGQTIQIRNTRTAGTGAGCAAASTTVSYPVVTQPVSPGIIPSVPPGIVCNGSSVSATFSPGSGGSGTVTDIYQISYNGGAFSSYTPSTPISTTGYNTITIRSQRNATGSGCTSSTPQTVTWNVVPLPTMAIQNGCVGESGSTRTNLSAISGTGPFTYTCTDCSPVINTGPIAGTGVLVVPNGSTRNFTVTDNNGCVSLPVTNTALGMPGSIVTNNQNASCIINGGNDFYWIVDGSGNAIASVNPNNQNLGVVTGTSYLELSPPVINFYLSFGSSIAMQRHWKLNSTIAPTSNVTIKFPFSNTEFTNLQTQSLLSYNSFDNVGSIADVGATRYSDTNVSNEDGSFANNNQTTGTFTFIPQSSNGVQFGGKFITVSTPGFSEWWLHGAQVPSPLPVSLVSFKGICENDTIRVEWITESETNSHKFYIESSIDLIAWNRVGEVSGAGFSNELRNYQISAVNNSGVTYFRLVQQDFDGTIEMFDPITVNCINSPLTNTIIVYPNPTEDEFTVSVESQDSYEKSRIQIYDMMGKSVRSYQVNLTKGTNNFSYNRSGMLPGTYTVSVELKPGFVRYLKLIVK